MKTVIILALLGSALCQWPPTPALTPAGVPPPPWEGPIADHEIGKQPPDTPEVAQARAYHLRAHQEVLSVLPVLPPEIRYQMTGLSVIPPQQAVPQQPQQVQQQQQFIPRAADYVPQMINNQILTDGVVRRWNGPFADHELGKQPSDTPEVAAAKNDHLAAHRHASSILPALPVEHQARIQPVQQQQQQYVGQPQFPRDTWDVEQAKLEHARKVAEALRLG